jgi:hypothetical protein
LLQDFWLLKKRVQQGQLVGRILQIMQLVVQTGPDAGKIFNLDRPMLIVGRQAGNEVLLNDAQVSRRHVQLELRNGQVFISDLGSANGTNVNGQRLMPNQPRPLIPGDLVQMGNSSLVVQGAVSSNYPPPPTPVYSSPSQMPSANPVQPPYNQPPPGSGYSQAPSRQPYPASGQVNPRAGKKNYVIPSVIGLLLVGGLLVGLIALLGSNNPGNLGGTTKPGIVNNPVQTTATGGSLPTPTVVRGLSGTNLPPPSPASLNSSSLSTASLEGATTNLNLRLRYGSG